MNEIWKIALAVVGSIGGVGAIIIATSSFLAKIISDKIIQKTEYRFSKEIENFKSQLEKKNYISKTRFDAEFNIYQQISNDVLTMVADTAWLFPAGGFDPMLPRDKQEAKTMLSERLSSAVKSYNCASITINQYAMFIPKETFEMLKDILSKCKIQIYWFPDLRLKDEDYITALSLAEQGKKCWNQTAEIQNSFDRLVNYVRSYLECLEVNN